MKEERSRGSIEVEVEVVPWLTSAFRHKRPGRLTFRKSISERMTLLELLVALTHEYPHFAAYVTCSDGEVSCPHLCLVLNDCLVTDCHRELHHGDRLSLVPVFAGGAESAIPN